MKKALSLILVSFALVSFAQEHPKPKLEEGDLDKFVKTIGPMSTEINELGGGGLFPDMLPYLDEMETVIPIFEKYGWSKGFGTEWLYLVCLSSMEDHYEMADIGKEPIFCDDIQLNPKDLIMVKKRAAEIAKAVERGFGQGE